MVRARDIVEMPSTTIATEMMSLANAGFSALPEWGFDIDVITMARACLSWRQALGALLRSDALLCKRVEGFARRRFSVLVLTENRVQPTRYAPHSTRGHCTDLHASSQAVHPHTAP